MLSPSWRRRWGRCGLPSSWPRRPRASEVKVRQPLSRAVIVANGSERAAIEAQLKLVTAELNVKELDFVSEEAELLELRGQTELPCPRPSLRQGHAAGCRRA